jgi:DNA sulfur modification protein DndC
MNTKIENILKDIRDTYVEDKRPWILGFSGGKDSTVLLKLVYNAIGSLPKKKLTKKIHVICCDTKVEPPNILEYLENTLKIIRKSASRESLPIIVKGLYPKVSDRFFANLVGRGYPSPNKWFRWCTDRLKIRPSTEYIKSIASREEVVILLGIRNNESSNRNKTMENYKIRNSKFNKHISIKNALVYAPIKALETNEIWAILTEPAPWGGNHKHIRFLYKQANGNECPLIFDRSSPSCGGSRFGCWVCTVIEKDKSMEGFIEFGGETWMQPLLYFRNYIAAKRNDLSCREEKRRNGLKGPGPFKLSFRIELLKKLIEIESKINMTLIEDEEKKRIEYLWSLDGYKGKSINQIENEIKNMIHFNNSNFLQ